MVESPDAAEVVNIVMETAEKEANEVISSVGYDEVVVPPLDQQMNQTRQEQETPAAEVVMITEPEEEEPTETQKPVTHTSLDRSEQQPYF